MIRLDVLWKDFINLILISFCHSEGREPCSSSDIFLASFVDFLNPCKTRLPELGSRTAPLKKTVVWNARATPQAIAIHVGACPKCKREVCRFLKSALWDSLKKVKRSRVTKGRKEVQLDKRNQP